MLAKICHPLYHLIVEIFKYTQKAGCVRLMYIYIFIKVK
jgi:hypothetical protein